VSIGGGLQLPRFNFMTKHTSQKSIPSLPQPRSRIVVGTNSLSVSQQAAYSNHCQMWYNFGKHYPNVDFCFVNPPRMTIDRMRNLAAETALEIGASHLLFIDDDVLLPLPFDFLDKLLKHDVDIAAADVLIRGFPFKHMIFKWDSPEKLGLVALDKVPRKRGPIKCGAVGFSCCLIKVDLLRKLSKPFFVTGVTNTEDIYFCVKAEKESPGTTVLADTSIVCGHILWNEIINDYNKKNYSKYWVAQNGKPGTPESEFRGKDYLASVKGVVSGKKTPKT